MAGSISSDDLPQDDAFNWEWGSYMRQEVAPAIGFISGDLIAVLLISFHVFGGEEREIASNVRNTHMSALPSLFSLCLLLPHRAKTDTAVVFTVEGIGVHAGHGGQQYRVHGGAKRQRRAGGAQDQQ
uniref:Uncharacterized protein n=1 Tax=Oryza glumipatula TaxID=40148 RepID=A0A0D9Y731_9ORYZ